MTILFKDDFNGAAGRVSLRTPEVGTWTPQDAGYDLVTNGLGQVTRGAVADFIPQLARSNTFSQVSSAAIVLQSRVFVPTFAAVGLWEDVNFRILRGPAESATYLLVFDLQARNVAPSFLNQYVVTDEGALGEYVNDLIIANGYNDILITADAGTAEIYINGVLALSTSHTPLTEDELVSGEVSIIVNNPYSRVNMLVDSFTITQEASPPTRFWEQLVGTTQY